MQLCLENARNLKEQKWYHLLLILTPVKVHQTLDTEMNLKESVLLRGYSLQVGDGEIDNKVYNISDSSSAEKAGERNWELQGDTFTGELILYI